MLRNLTNKQIVEKLLVVLEHSTRTSLFQDLEVSKQSISQFAKQEGIDINNKIITRLIEKLEQQ